MTLSRLRVAMLAAAVLLVGCDHGTKRLAGSELEHRPPRALVAGVFDLDYTENRDTGFGLLRSVPENIRTPFLTAVQLLAGLSFLLVSLRRKSRPSLRAALLLISAGALGNGLDRLARGCVVDFLHLDHWPVFNVADLYITAGGILLFIAARAARPGPLPA
jgi:signal peptidase II